MNTIKSKWEHFEGMCLRNVTDQQRDEARTAFYAGVMSLLVLQDRVASIINSPEEAGMAVQAWQQELELFKAEAMAKILVKAAQSRH